MNNLQLSVLLNAIDKMSTPVKNASKSVNALSKTLKENKAAQFQLLKQNRENENAIKKYAATLNPLKNKLSELNHTLHTAKQKAAFFEQQLANSTNPTAEFKTKVEMAKNAVKRLKEEQQQAALKLRTARAELQKSGISAKQLGSKQNELRQKMKAANAQIQNQRIELEKLNTKQAKYQQYRHKVEHLKNVSGNVQMMGASASAAGTAITTPIAGMVKEHMSFEDAMVGVARQVQGLKDSAGNFTAEFDKWKNKIKALSEELPLTTVEIANMIEAAARMDIPKEELEDFVRLNTQMATAFDAANPDELVEQFGKVSKNFKLSTQSTRELADAINYLDDNAISKGTSIIGFLNRVSGVAGIAKITDKNLAALGSTLQTAGAEEESSATAVNAIFTRLSSASKKKPVRNALSALGLSANQVELGMVKDAQGTIMKIVNALKKMPEQKRLGFIADLVGTEHTKTLALLVSNTEEWKRQIALANSEEAKGSMGREFDTRMKAMSASFVIFQNKLFNLSETIGGTIAPTINKLMQQVGMIIDKFRAWIEANPELANKIMMIVSAIGGALTVFGALSMALSFLIYPIARIILGFNYFLKISAILGKGISFLGKAFLWFGKIAAQAIMFVGRAMLTNPILLAITLIIGAIALLWYNWDSVCKWVKEKWDWVSQQVSIIGNKISAFFSESWENIKQFFSNALDNIILIISKWSPLFIIKNIFKSVLDYFGIELPESFLSFGTNLMNKLTEGIKNGLKVVKETISNVGTSTLNWFKEKLGMGGGEQENKDKPAQYATGGYTGNGNKYDPAGIVHRGEFVFNKSATSSLGVGFLSTLHNAKSAKAGMLAAGLASGVAMAQPFQIDNRPPIAMRPAPTQSASPMNVQITINGANGSPQDIATAVRQELAKLQNREQAKARSSLRDRG